MDKLVRRAFARETFEMASYLLFAGFGYYPSGGFEDFIGEFSSIEDANNKVKELDVGSNSLSTFDWYHIIEVGTWKEVQDES